MKVLDLTLPTPAENLALDEALLDCCEAGGEDEVLRFWEPREYFVVVGYANKIDVEVNRAACEQINVPILRRCSGGGTVLQGPGCLNYTLVMKIADEPTLQTIPQTNDFVMERQRRAVQRAMKCWSAGVLGKTHSTNPSLQYSNTPVLIRGHTDLALGELKFSGNAQRRKRTSLLFHGSFLLNFELELIAKLLNPPSKEPDYRHGRLHLDFLTNLGIPSEKIKAALQNTWRAETALSAIPDFKGLVESKYSRPEWNLKF